MEQIHHFELERSNDGSNWTMLNAAIAPAETSYSGDTEIPAVGSSFYYRLTGKTSPSNLYIPYNIVSLLNPASNPGICALQRHFGGKTGVSGSGAVIYKATTDLAGNVLLCGRHNYTVNYGTGDLVQVLGTGGDAFLAKYASNGQAIQAIRWGLNSTDWCADVAVDGQGNIIVIGVVSTGLGVDTKDFGFGPITTNGGAEIYVVKLDTNMNLIWHKIFGGSGSDIGVGVAVDSSNSVYITGTYGLYGTPPDFGGGALPAYGSQSTNVFVAKFNSSGVHQWSKGWGGTGQDSVIGIAVSTTGVYVAGQFTLTGNFGAGDWTSPDNQTDIFLCKYSLITGDFDWGYQIGDPASFPNKVGHVASKVVADSAGNVYLTGLWGTRGGIDFGGGQVFTDPNGVGSVFISKHNPSGVLQWVKPWYGDLAAPFVGGLAVDSQANLYVCGSILYPFDFGVGFHLIPGGPKAYLVKIDTNGVTKWSRTSGTPPGSQEVNATGTAVAVTPAGQIIMAGDCGQNFVPVFNTQEFITTPGTVNNNWWTRWTP